MKINKKQYYKAVVPDTLDLAERAALAINGLGGTVDPNNDYLMYFDIRFNTNPPYMQHRGGADTSCTPKFAESLPLLRTMCGTDQHLDTEKAMLNYLVSCNSKDVG